MATRATGRSGATRGAAKGWTRRSTRGGASRVPMTANGPKSPANKVWSSVWSAESEWHRAAVAGENWLECRYTVVKTSSARARAAATVGAHRTARERLVMTVVVLVADSGPWNQTAARPMIEAY